MCRSIIETTRRNDFSGRSGFSKNLYRTVNLLWIVAAVALWFHPTMAQAAAIDWEGWSFDVSTNNNSSGLVLSNVKYGEKVILAKASMPVMRVEYDNDVCGPYADILSRYALRSATAGAPDSACDGQAVCQRTFTRNGEQMLEIGSNWQIGEYQIYQTYYFSENGYIDARVYSRGLQCTVNHAHHAHWLFDFDIEGPENDQIRRESGSVETSEFNDLKSNTDFWTIQDSVSGQQVRVVPSVDDGEPDDFSETDVAVRAYKSSETGRWSLGARGEIGDNYMNNESIDNTDLVFWYVSHLPHSASEGSSLWHASGPRIEVLTEEPLPPPPPTSEPPPEPTAFNLLANGDFESGKAGWFDCGNDANTTVADSSVQGSTSGLRINNGGCLYQEVTATAGDSYTLSCQAERSGANWTIMELSYLDADYNSIQTEIQQINADGSFSAYQLSGTAPSNTAYALTLLYSEDDTIFDNCVLVAGISTEPEPEPSPGPANPSGTNLLSNAEFESGLTNWNSCASAELVSVSDDSQSGAQALNITGSGCLYQEFPITPGNAYAMSCQAKYTGALYTSITLALMDENYTALQTTEVPVNSTNYGTYNATLTAPTGSRTGTVVMYSEEPGQFDSCTVVLAGDNV
ncbi:MAG: carbohydrate binding domain-containing protein [Granulosicoccus sp.]|nr:carbohydrate binding domain-containing protein [Granulosicoccus sp.]